MGMGRVMEGTRRKRVVLFLDIWGVILNLSLLVIFIMGSKVI